MRTEVALLEVVHLQRVVVMRDVDAVAKVYCLLPRDASDVAAAENELRAPQRALGFLFRTDVIRGTEEEVRQLGAADAVVPLAWMWLFREGLAPDVADVLDVVGVVHV